MHPIYYCNSCKVDQQSGLHLCDTGYIVYCNTLGTYMAPVSGNRLVYFISKKGSISKIEYSSYGIWERAMLKLREQLKNSKFDIRMSLCIL